MSILFLPLATKLIQGNMVFWGIQQSVKDMQENSLNTWQNAIGREMHTLLEMYRYYTTDNNYMYELSNMLLKRIQYKWNQSVWQPVNWME